VTPRCSNQHSIAWVFTWDDGLIVRIVGYIDPEDARTAAERLAEEGGSRA
jgi:hypothetical protein